MKKGKRFFDLLPAMLMWLVLSILVWGFVFARITDAPAAQKITLYVDAPVPRSVEMAAELETAAHEGIRMVKVHPFSYAMMGADAMENADMYILPRAHLEEYLEHFVPLPREWAAAEGAFCREGVPLGLKVFDGESGKGAAAEYITYVYPGMEGQDYFLFFGKNSLHVPGNEGAVDAAALYYLEKLLALN